jgi:hypothetical protein
LADDHARRRRFMGKRSMNEAPATFKRAGGAC